MNKNLPVYLKREEIIEAVKVNDVTIITAETGSGKSTQIPQYLLTEGYSVVVTEPRRVAAVSLADRVSEEISNDSYMEKYPKDIVGYKTAFESTVTENTKILFCTDGLKVARGLSQNKSTVLVIDEVHEWNLNIETLVAWVKHWNNNADLEGHNKVKVVIMSATMDSSALEKFFSCGKVSVVHCSGTLYDVEMYDRHSNDLVETIVTLYNSGKNVLVFEPGKSEIQEVVSALKSRVGGEALILPMHSELSMVEQKKVFESYNCNKIVVSTNIAQTSVTIPDIDAVVDTGTEKVVNTVDGIEGLFLREISKADCKQRAGRAGRTKEGVYYLCSNVQYEDRKEFNPPEIQRLVLDKVVLKLFSVGIDPRELEFFHKVDKCDIEKSIEVLQTLGALSNSCEVTKVGKRLSLMPVSVRYAKMLLEAEKAGCLREMIKAVSIMETGSLVNTRKKKDCVWNQNYSYADFTGESKSDVLAELTIYNNAVNHKYKNLSQSGINSKNFFRVKEMVKKLTSLLSSELSKESKSTKVDSKKIRYCILCGFVDRLFVDCGYWGDYLDLKGNSYKLDRNSCIGDYNLLVGTPKIISYEDRYGYSRTMNIATMCTSVSIDMLKSAVGNEVVEGYDFEEGYFDYLYNTVDYYKVYMYRGVVVYKKRVSVNPDSDNYNWALEVIKNTSSFKNSYYIMPNGSIRKIHSYISRYIDVEYKELDLFNPEEPVLWNGVRIQLQCKGFMSMYPGKLKTIVEDNELSEIKKPLKMSFHFPTANIEKVCSHMIPLCGTREQKVSYMNKKFTLYIGLDCMDGKVCNRVFKDKKDCDIYTKAALHALAGSYISSRYPSKMFKTKEVRDEFTEMCYALTADVSVSNFSRVLKGIDESYKKSVTQSN